MTYAGVVVIKVARAQQGNGDSLSTLGESFTECHDAKKRNNLSHVQSTHVKSQLSFLHSPAVFCSGSYYRFKSLLPGLLPPT